MIRILIADDHAIVRRGLKQIVEGQPDMAVLGEAATAAEAMRLIRHQDWDVVVLDINMPGQSGLEVLAQIRQRKLRLPVLVLSGHPEDQYAVRVLKSGAAGYLTKETAPDELVKAVRKVHAGGKYVSPSLAERLASDLAPEAAQRPHERLTDREYQIMCLIGSGKTVGQIADILCRSVKTISTHRTRILEKMGMQTNAELTRYVVEHRLAD